MSPDITADGVYAFRDMYVSTIIELKRGHYRLWHASDIGQFEKWWPAAGTFSLNEKTVTLQDTDFSWKTYVYVEHAGNRYLTSPEEAAELKVTGRLRGLRAVGKTPEQLLTQQGRW